MDKKYENQIEELKQRILYLETVNKHLSNELKLTEEEKEKARSSYYDIIEHMEEKVDQRTREIKELQKISESKSIELQIIIDSAPYMIFYKDLNMRYIQVNHEFARSLGVPIKRIIGKTLHEIFPDVTDQIWMDDQEVIKNGKPILNSSVEVNTTTNGIRYILVNKIPYIDSDEHIIGIIGFALDITDVKQAEREKQDLLERIAQMEKMEAIGRLAGGVAHDLNNVLSAVVSYPDLLLMELPENSPLRKPIITMQKSGQKAAAIVEDLLTLARRGVPITETVNLNRIITNYFDSPEFETLRIFNPHVSIEYHLADDLLNIQGSPIHLTKTLMNLVSNAAEATLRRGTVTISTSNRYLEKPLKSYDLCIPEGEYVVLKVSDTGIGINPDDLKKIFEPFYTKKVMGRSGTGLGMAVVWGTVKDHKGNINVLSVEGKGTIFEIYFPASRNVFDKDNTVIPVKKYSGNRERILVVDDVQDQRDISSMLLTSLNYSVETASSGEAAVEFLESNRVDLVILDMIMDPGIDGLDTYKKILEIHPGQRAIITSGFSETDRVREALSLGVGHYIKKPYTLEKLGLAVRAELDRA